MQHVLNVTRLHMNKREQYFLVPVYITAVVLVITMIIAAILQRAGLDPTSPAYADGARQNGGMVWSLPGFLVYFGVQAVATTFPFALALGATRRAFIAGTAIANLVQAAWITLIASALLGLELATGHWFFGAYALDIHLLGAGDFARFAPTVFLGAFTALSIGGVFGAVWVRYGQRGPLVLAIVLALALVALLLIIVPRIGEIFAAITGFKLALGAIAASLAAVLGTWWCMRRAAVR